ncbi:replication-relaxation family protein (plasmid) [Paenibacillus sonchi]|uniref:Replication-relaxation family protein n=1 Tax=Paenibacillus sonchi TaxID=373687 RepID=A0A974SHF8_9BACL|nr:replication-relaxation family protein [Paenibacillus sonchi]QQZ64630.1 replication-relaxation family protein [Paenibacillus sonchi]
MAANNEPRKAEGKKRTTKGDWSVGEIIDLLNEKEWEILTDLYFCRCMPQSAMIPLYFWADMQKEVSDYESKMEKAMEGEEDQEIMRAARAHKYTMQKLKSRGLIESSNFNSNTSVTSRRASTYSSKKEMWYYLSTRGLKIIEARREVLEENRLSKNELDMERAKKNHFWELAKVYLDLKYKILNQMESMIQFIDWDWYPSYSIYSDEQTYSIRPDAILRIGEQLFFIELDRSTEPVQRSPFHNNQVSIEKKISRYRDVIKLSSNCSLKQGIIAFIVPGAIQNTRLQNIERAAEKVFGPSNRVYSGRTISEIITGLL